MPPDAERPGPCSRRPERTVNTLNPLLLRFQWLILLAMPSRRKLLVLAAVPLATAILALVGLVFRYDLTGWLRGEAKYKGKYTCEWRAEIERWELVRGGLGPRDLNTLFWAAKPTPFDDLRDFLGFRNYPPLTDRRLLDGDLEALPVLLELLRDHRPQVRLSACQGLANIGPVSKAALPALHKALNDRDSDVRSAAVRALSVIGGWDK